MVNVRKMHAHEAGEIARIAGEVSPPSEPLKEAVKVHPERVRVAHVGSEVVGGFVLTELEGGVEEISAMAFTETGMKSGAERAVVEYVVGAARFARKRAVEVVARPGTAEARHLETEGFKRVGKGDANGLRFRIDVKR